MKRLLLLILLASVTVNVAIAQKDVTLITSDIDNFCNAYDKIATTKDSAQQYEYLNKLFIEKGTPGLAAMMKARSYTPKSYIDVINKNPSQWDALRANKPKISGYTKDITANIEKLRAFYPELIPAEIYFTVGAFRSGGTTQGHMILIGSEVAMNPEPLKNLTFTVIHEYVHTQQKSTEVDLLVGQCVMEGVAEFVAEKATGIPSTLPAKKYGMENFEKVRDKFAQQMFNTQNGFWLYSDAANEFGVRDLGYYIGYTICEMYYAKAIDKKQAVKEMIGVDYNNEADLARFIDAAGYFTKPVNQLRKEYEANRPMITVIKPFNNNDINVDAKTKQITLEFSKPMNKGRRNFELGPLGKSNLLKLTKFIGFSEDGHSFTFETELAAGQQYQIVFGEGFKDLNGAALKPYLLNFKTAAN